MSAADRIAFAHLAEAAEQVETALSTIRMLTGPHGPQRSVAARLAATGRFLGLLDRLLDGLRAEGLRATEGLDSAHVRWLGVEARGDNLADALSRWSHAAARRAERARADARAGGFPGPAPRAPAEARP